MDKQIILVSIGISFYNTEEYLDFAIRSVLSQTYSNWELFLLDDGSEDASLSIAKKYEYDQRITVISDGRNKGLPTRLNELSALAKGKYYARMDADDIMFPERIASQLKFLEENQDVDVVGSSAVAIDNENRAIGLRKVNAKLILNQKYVLQHGCFIHPSIMGKSQWFKQNSYNAKLKRAQDFELWVRTVDESKFTQIEDCLLFYREGSIPTLKKYWKGKLFESSVVKNYREVLGNVEYLNFQLRNLLKMGLYLLFYCFGKLDYLVSRRSLPLSFSEQRLYNGMLGVFK